MKEEQSQVCTYNGSVGTSLWLHYRKPHAPAAVRRRKLSMDGLALNRLPFVCPGALRRPAEPSFQNQEGTRGGPQGIRVTYRASSPHKNLSSSKEEVCR